MFGAKKDDAPSKPAAPMFGGLNQNKDADKPASSPSLFAPAQNKDAAAQPAAPPAGNLFGGLGAKKDDAAKPASPAGGLFGNLGGAKKNDAAAPSTTPTSATTPSFSLGAKPTDSSTPASTGGPTFGLKPAAAPAAGNSGGNGGNSGGPPTIAAAPAAGPNNGGNGGPLGSNTTGGLGSGLTGSNTTGSSTTGVLGSNTANASTSGPAPPAASRLNSKSLDEIITLWTTSLTSHQKQFSNLANKIGSWDRMLVENSDKISKLYSRTFQAERDTAEVERQLASVEGQQEELSHWLDHYERVLNDMAAKAGGVDSGVDAERERTYVYPDQSLRNTRLTTNIATKPLSAVPPV
jgi:nuclear pore complex protein Nup62